MKRGTSRIGLAPRDVALEALASLRKRVGRTVLLGLGAAVGTGVLSVSLTAAASAAARVRVQFDELRATRIIVADPNDAHWINSTGLAAARELPGVSDVGIETVTADPIVFSPTVYSGINVPVSAVAADASALRAVGAQLVQGRLYDEGMAARHEPVVLLGAALAQSLGNPPVDGNTAVIMNGQPVLVLGIVTAAPHGDPSVLLNAYLPSTLSISDPSTRWQTPQTVINTVIGRTDVIATALPLALAPAHVGELVVQTPADPQGLRAAVSGQLQVLLQLLGVIALAVGTIVIGTAALSAVGQRRADIALRRALGTSRLAVYCQILLETLVTGGAGGLIGGYGGQLTSLVVSVYEGWPIVTNILLLPISALLGLLAGVLGGVYPAAAAAMAQPADALRT